MQPGFGGNKGEHYLWIKGFLCNFRKVVMGAKAWDMCALNCKRDPGGS